MTETHRILIFQLEKTYCARMPEALEAAGFEVAALCPRDCDIVYTRHLKRHYAYGATPSRSVMQWARTVAGAWAPRAVERVRRVFGPVLNRVVEAEHSGARMLAFLIEAVRDWRPVFILCGDEPTRLLLCSAVRAANAGRSPLPDDVLSIVRLSLGDPEFFEQTNRKSALMAYCARAGYPAPPNEVVTLPEQVDTFAARHGYPVMLKLDFQAGGWGVASASSSDEARDAMRRLAEISPYDHPPQCAANEIVVSPSGPPTLSVQKQIDGPGRNVCLAAIDGKVLANFTVVKHIATKRFAPSSVVRFVFHEETDRIARGLIEHLRFTGICDIQFIVDRDTGKSYVIELNPRPTPSCHLGDRFGADLSRALHAALGGPAYQAAMPKDLDWTVARFPQEWLRDPNSEWLTTVYHDVPWDDPGLIERLCGGPEAARRFYAQFPPPEAPDALIRSCGTG